MLATSALEFGVWRWLDERRAAGWQAEVDAVAVSGFPARFDMTLEAVALADPATGIRVAAQDLRIAAPSYWPADVTVFLPSTPVEISTADTVITLTAPTGQTTLRLHPKVTLQLDHLTASSGPWVLNLPQGNLLQAQDFRAEVSQTDDPKSYRFALSASQLIPGAMIRTALNLPLDWPLAFDVFGADMVVNLDAPIDRLALENRPPQPREIAVERAEAEWGPLRLSLHGNLLIDESGTPEGQLDLLVENWRDAVDLAEQSGAMPQNMRPRAEIMLNALANMGADPASLDLKLRFANGGMFLGPIPIGPAPKLILR